MLFASSRSAIFLEPLTISLSLEPQECISLLRVLINVNLQVCYTTSTLRYVMASQSILNGLKRVVLFSPICKFQFLLTIDTSNSTVWDQCLKLLYLQIHFQNTNQTLKFRNNNSCWFLTLFNIYVLKGISKYEIHLSFLILGNTSKSPLLPSCGTTCLRYLELLMWQTLIEVWSNYAHLFRF